MPPTASTITDPYLDQLYETLRLYRHGAFGVACPECRAQPGQLCRARRSVHRARRDHYKVSLGACEVVLDVRGAVGRPVLSGQPVASASR